MLILPIKRKWLEMIRSGEKKEEYRALSPYYAARFKRYLGWESLTMPNKVVEDTFRAAGAKGVPFDRIVLRGGYSLFSPATLVKGRITIGEGKPEWGAKQGEEYYILRIDDMEDLLTVDGQRRLTK